MFPEVWERVVGRSRETIPAEVAGFAVFRARHAAYPVMMSAAPKLHVAGLVYLGVDATVLARLDQYESDLYDRLPVTATLHDGRVLTCEAYVLPATRRHLASDEPWDAETFRLEQLPRYLNENT
jgi:hypothetical protein